MLFHTIAALSAVGLASAAVEIPNHDIAAKSKLGNRILSAAKQTTRGLDQNDNDYSWQANYSIKFVKCATTDEYWGGDLGGEDNQNQNDFYGMYKQRLVHFKLCPTSNGCDSCTNGADYVIDMNAFVEAFVESKMDAQEYNCEQVRETCYQDNEQACYAAAGLDYCDDEDNNNNNNNAIEFNLEEAAECRELDVDEDALQAYYYNQGGNANQQQYNYQDGQNNQEMNLFVGPYCSANGKSIFLGTFMDEMCSYPAPSGTYEKFSYGQALPYESENLIDNGCLSCKEPQEYDQNNNGDQEDEDEVIEICESMYEDSAKCESGLADGVTYYKNTYGCNFIKSLKAPGKMSSKSSVSASKVFAGLFAATTIVLAGVAYYLYDKSRRANVALNSDGGGALA